jgi:hypothetical protein
LSKKKQEEEKGELESKTRIRPASGASGCLFHWEIVNKKKKKQQKKTGSHLMCIVVYTQSTDKRNANTNARRDAERRKGRKDTRKPTGLKNLKQMATPKEMAQGNFVDSMPFHGDRTHQNLPTTRSHDAHILIAMAYRIQNLKKKETFLFELFCFVFHQRNLVAISCLNAPKVRRYIYCN